MEHIMAERTNEWATAEHATAYLKRADGIVNREHGEAMVNDLVPRDAARILDLGTGDGRLLAFLKQDRPNVAGVALDFSPVMIESARARFQGDPAVEVVAHNLNAPLPDLGTFDAVVSCFAIHHLPDDRKAELYAEIFEILRPGGIFCNLEHVAPTSHEVHMRWLTAMGRTLADEDPSNLLVPVDTQVGWLRDIGFIDPDCFWKWYEFAVLAGWKPAAG